MYPFLKSWIEAKQESANVSQLPDMTTYGSNNGDASQFHEPIRKSDPGPGYPALFKVASEGLSPNRNMKDYGTQISDLKKENFSLKLRIFYMEERMQDSLDVDHEKIIRTNIELKVECDAIRRELQDKHDLLVKASNAVACMESNGPEELRRARIEAENELKQLKEIMNEKVQSAERDLLAAQHDAEATLQQALDLKKKLEEVQSVNKALNQELLDARSKPDTLSQQADSGTIDDKPSYEQEQELSDLKEEITKLHEELHEKESTIDQLKESLSSKRTVVELLNEEKQSIFDQQVSPMIKEMEHIRQKIKDLEAELKAATARENTAQTRYQEHIVEQQQRLDEYELATKQMSEELDKRETEVKDLKQALDEAEELNSDLSGKLEDLENDSREKETRGQKDINKRDRAIAGLTKLMKKKDEQIESLNEDIKEQQIKAEELADAIHKFDMQKPASSTKDNLIDQLRKQLKQSDSALQDALDEKLKTQDEHDNQMRSSIQQMRELERESAHLKSSLQAAEETTVSMEQLIHEKEKAFKDLTNKHKELLKELKQKEEQRISAMQERDALLIQCEEEKLRFTKMSRKMLRRSSSDLSSSISNTECDRKICRSTIDDLQIKLTENEDRYLESQISHEKTTSKLKSCIDDLKSSLRSKEEEVGSKEKSMAQMDVELHHLKEVLQCKQEAIEKLKAEMSSKVTNVIKSSQDECESYTTEIKILHEKVATLTRRIAEKDTAIQKLHHTQLEQLNVGISESKFYASVEAHRVNNHHCDDPQNGQRKSEQKRPNQVGNHTSFCNFTMVDGGKREQFRKSLNRSKLHFENIHGNGTMNTTIGFGLDNTSYMDIPDGRYGNANDDEDDGLSNLSTFELKQVLRNTRNQLSDSIREIADLRAACNQLNDKLEQIEIVIDEKTMENELLNQEKFVKESEILGLLSRIKDSEKHPDSRSSVSEDLGSEDGSLSFRSRHKSGEESDGMSNFSRKELHHKIQNLRKKLQNAEMVNELLKRQVQSKSTLEANDSMNPQLVMDLAAEVNRLKEQLDKQEKSKPTLDKKMPVSIMKSRIPIPKNHDTKTPEMTVKQDLELARSVNRKLSEKLTATEQTVRQQGDKLNKCRAAMREAGIYSPPCSPIRAARSVPNLHISDVDDVVTKEVVDAESAKRLHRNHSNEANDRSTQTYSNDDSGIASVTPKSEEKFNSLIQAQAKELSVLREKLKKSRDTSRHLATEMDVVTRYIKTLLDSSADNVDPMIASSIGAEIERSKQLVHKLQKHLADNIDTSQSESDGDGSILSSASKVVNDAHNNKIQRLSSELEIKVAMVAELESKLEKLHAYVDSMQPHRAVSRLTGDTYSKDKWSSWPNLQTDTGSQLDSSFKKCPSVNDERNGMLTPSTSHCSLQSGTEDEILLNPSDSRLPSKLDSHDDRFATLPSSLDHPIHRSSWPYMQSIQGTPTRKSMPMYQRTIAVTEYLPFNAKSNRDRTHSSVDDLIGEGIRRKLLSASHEAQCTAAFGGAWTPSTTPTKSERTSSYKPSTMNNRDQSYESSCDEVHDHKLSRELDRLRRRLSDSKKINRTLKEELDLVNKSLQKAKESAVPGYQRSRRSPTDLLADHLSEIRGLRQRLEKSIATNDKLREKLEQQLQNNEDNPEHLSAKMSPNNSMKHDTQEADELRRRLFLLKSENKELLTRLGSEDEAKVAYADAIHELNTLHSHILEKSTQTDMLNRHVEQLQREVRQQTALAGKLETDLSASQAELDSYKHKVEQLQSEKNEATLRGKKAVERTHQLNKELDHMHAQLNECRQLIDSLKCEVDIHEKVERRESAFHQPEIDLSELLAEVRSLRVQLERSINTNSALRKQLEDQLKHPRTPERDVSHTTINIRHLTPPQRGAKMSSSPKSLHSARRKLKLDTLIAEDSAMMTPPASASSGAEELGGKSFPFDSKSIHHQSDHEGFAKIPVTCSTHGSETPLYCEKGQFALCKMDDFTYLQQSILDSGLLAQATEDQVAEKLRKIANDKSMPLAKKILRDISVSIGAIRRHLNNSDHILCKFWPASLPMLFDNKGRKRSFTSSGVATGGLSSTSESTMTRGPESAGEYVFNSETDGLRREVGKLRRRLSTQDKLLQSTVERLQTTNRMKEGIEHAIVKQLSKTHDVLRKARGNLEAKVNEPIRQHS